MSLQGQHSPNSINLLAALLNDSGLKIGQQTTQYAGSSTGNNYTNGAIANITTISEILKCTTKAYTKLGAQYFITSIASTSVLTFAVPTLVITNIANNVCITGEGEHGLTQGDILIPTSTTNGLTSGTSYTVDEVFSSTSFSLTGTTLTNGSVNIICNLPGFYPTLSVNDVIVPATTDKGLVAGTAYWVFDKPSLTSFRLKTSYAAVTFINTLTNGSCDITVQSNVSQSTYDSLLSIGSANIRALGNSAPNGYIYKDNTNAGKQYGFIKEVAFQAYSEFKGQNYDDFCAQFTGAMSYKDQVNASINSLVNSKNYLKGFYSNMNDLSTADITGVNQATLFWGQDLIKLGRSIDLAYIDKFGLPSILLRTLNRNNAITEPLTVALIYSGLSTSDITQILETDEDLTTIQEQKILGAFSVIIDNDLFDILLILNCQTSGINSLADLLNPIKLFPTSYASLVVPEFRSNPSAGNKVYYNIYNNGAVNSDLERILFPTFKNYLNSIQSGSIAIACGAFAFAMSQIKNIKNVSIEKFSQVVTNLETMTNLNQVNGENGLPVYTGPIDIALAKIAVGTGNNGTLLATDFYAALSGLETNLETIFNYINELQNSGQLGSLLTIYQNIYTILNGTGPYNASLATEITNANNAITTIYNNNQTTGNSLITLWNKLGTAFDDSNTLRNLALPDDVEGDTSSIISFVDSINTWALDTQPNQTAAVLEQIADRSTIGGQSLIALMREIRNANRLSLCGLELDNDISNNAIDQDLNAQGGVGTIGPTTISTSSGVIDKIIGDTSDPGYPFPGTLGDSPESKLIPPDIDIFNISPTINYPPQTPSQALQEVIDCNCDCWDLLE